jgi:hypothetical protein
LLFRAKHVGLFRGDKAAEIVACRFFGHSPSVIDVAIDLSLYELDQCGSHALVCLLGARAAGAELDARIEERHQDVDVTVPLAVTSQLDNILGRGMVCFRFAFSEVAQSTLQPQKMDDERLPMLNSSLSSSFCAITTAAASLCN